jgi:hypothetical protein
MQHSCQHIGRDEMYLPLPEVEGKLTGLEVCLAANAIIYHMSRSFTANHHSPSSFVPIIMLLLHMTSLRIFNSHVENYLSVEQELLLQQRAEPAHKQLISYPIVECD